MNRSQILTGRPELPVEPLDLNAGKLTLQFENGAIRYIKAGNIELLRMIYPAVRDRNWGTLEPKISDDTIDLSRDEFEISYFAEYQQNDISFQARYTLSGSETGIRFSMKGAALSSFFKNRIGFCVLHPMDECKGKPCTIHHPDGKRTEARFPDLISPHQPFLNIESMNWSPVEALQARLVFSGDIFETEDQRNWTDASYKTYSTPLAEPFPVLIEKGSLIEQTVELTVSKEIQAANNSRLSLSLTDKKIPLPKIGIGSSSADISDDEKSIQRLKSLNLSHIRIDIKLGEPGWQQKLDGQLAVSETLNLKPELALHLSPDQTTALCECMDRIKSHEPSPAAVTLYHSNKKTTDQPLINSTVSAIRKALPGIPVGGGTDCYFTELNRERTPVGDLDYLTFSINPQVHAFDNQSLTETLEGQREAVQSAIPLSDGKAVHISPVTLKPRFNPNATEPEILMPGELLSRVDPRQMSLFGAVWTLGSIKFLAESGAHWLTYFESIGECGLMQGPIASMNDEKFPAEAHQVFPMWQIFKWVQDFAGGTLIPVTSSAPLELNGLSLKKNGQKRMLIANHTLKPQTLPMPDGMKAVAFLDETTAPSFMRDPGTLLSRPVDTDTLTLLPYATACIDS